MSYLGHGPVVWCKRWNDMEWFDTTASCLINYRGWPACTMHMSASARLALCTT